MVTRPVRTDCLELRSTQLESVPAVGTIKRSGCADDADALSGKSGDSNALLPITRHRACDPQL